MFRGEFLYSLDEKGRVVLPPKFRRELGDVVIVTRGFDECLWVYSQKEWERVEGQLSGLPLRQRNFQRFLLASAREVEVDRQGRVSLPEGLREYAGIDRDVVVVGLIHRLEIWSGGRWKQAMSKTQKEAAKIAEEIDINL